MKRTERRSDGGDEHARQKTNTRNAAEAQCRQARACMQASADAMEEARRSSVCAVRRWVGRRRSAAANRAAAPRRRTSVDAATTVQSGAHVSSALLLLSSLLCQHSHLSSPCLLRTMIAVRAGCLASPAACGHGRLTFASTRKEPPRCALAQTWIERGRGKETANMQLTVIHTTFVCFTFFLLD